MEVWLVFVIWKKKSKFNFPAKYIFFKQTKHSNYLDEDVEGLGAPLEVEFVKFWEVDELLFDGAGSMIWGYWKKNLIDISWNKALFYNFGISPILDNTKVFPPKIFQIILLTLFWCSSCHWRKSCCCFSLNS